MVTPLTVALAANVIMSVLISLAGRATTTKLRTHQATVIEKRRKIDVVYAGLFLPSVKHILITDRGLQAETTR